MKFTQFSGGMLVQHFCWVNLSNQATPTEMKMLLIDYLLEYTLTFLIEQSIPFQERSLSMNSSMLAVWKVLRIAEVHVSLEWKNLLVCHGVSGSVGISDVEDLSIQKIERDSENVAIRSKEIECIYALVHYEHASEGLLQNFLEKVTMMRILFLSTLSLLRRITSSFDCFFYLFIKIPYSSLMTYLLISCAIIFIALPTRFHTSIVIKLHTVYFRIVKFY